MFGKKIKSGKAFVGLSGGVDSAVSAALLKKEWYEVTGVFIRIQIPGYPCTAAEDRVEAMRVAAHLGIPFMEVDLSQEYQREVFAPSIEEFKTGNTPNPDTLCNERIKFGIFFDFCVEHGADYVATGHYAQTRDGRLYVSADENKDQSYFLWAVPEERLRRTLFPVGDKTKPDVRRLARKFGLPNRARKDSQGLCFLGDIGMEDMLEREVPQAPGAVLSETGEEIGTHRGAAYYTLGQRHGFTQLSLGEAKASHADAKPLYVIAKDMERNTITVSESRFPNHAHKTRIEVGNANWIGTIEDGPCQVRYRYRQTLIPAALRKEASGGERAFAEIVLDEPHYVPHGQSLVLYRGDQCLGGGVIKKAELMA